MNRYAYGLLAIWLILLGVMTWSATQRTVIAPIWDQQTYLDKSVSFWAAVEAGKPFNPLDLEPTVRPPGTVLMTAPFGPVDDFREFYFRSVFLPVVVFVISLLIVGFATRVHGVCHALLTATLCSMPLFWHFEMTDAFRVEYFWGLVDTFFASVAALAAAIFVLAAARRSLIWFAAGVSIALLLPLIKPAGFIVYMTLVGCWAVLLVIRIRADSRGLRGEILRMLGTISAATTCVGLLAWASTNSDYLSKTNIEFGKEAVRQLNAMELSLGMKEYLGMISSLAGFPALMILSVLLGGFFVGKVRGRNFDLPQTIGWLSVLGTLVVIVGILVCYQTTLLRQIRYFYPFLLVAAALALPFLVVLLRSSGAWLKVGACVSPIALLLFIVIPGYEMPARNLLGCSIFSGQFKAFPEKIQECSEPADLSRPGAPFLYTTGGSAGVAAFEACYIDAFKSSGVTGGPPSVLRPFNWRAAPMIVLREITDSELIVFAPNWNEPAKAPITYREELVAWEGWLSSDPPPDGTHIVLSEGKIRCLRVNDRAAFESASEVFFRSREWRPEFLLANERSRFSPAEIVRDSASMIGPEEPMDFGGIIRVHRLDWEVVGGALKLTVFAERTTDSSTAGLVFFIHQTAADGEIISSHAIPMPSFKSKTYPVERVVAEIKIEPKAEKIGFGVFQAGVGALLTDERAQDWDHRRLMLPAHPN